MSEKQTRDLSGFVSLKLIKDKGLIDADEYTKIENEIKVQKNKELGKQWGAGVLVSRNAPFAELGLTLTADKLNSTFPSEESKPAVKQSSAQDNKKTDALSEEEKAAQAIVKKQGELNRKLKKLAKIESEVKKLRGEIKIELDKLQRHFAD